MRRLNEGYAFWRCGACSCVTAYLARVELEQEQGDVEARPLTGLAILASSHGRQQISVFMRAAAEAEPAVSAVYSPLPIIIFANPQSAGTMRSNWEEI